MRKHKLNAEQINGYGRYLLTEERSHGTMKKYLRDIRAFANWISDGLVTKEVAMNWKAYLLERGYAPVSVNAMLSALNGLFRFLGWNDCRVKFLKIQRKLFRDSNRELSRTEYTRLVSTARESGRERLALVMETICATGIRVSELRYITVEAARCGHAEIRLKGKIRVILLPGKLCRKLLKYAKRQKNTSGEIFITRSGKGLGRRQIWAEMKLLCGDAFVDASRVFPHNLRHLFATTFYRTCKDIVQLADMLGHSCIETTRIYLATSSREHMRQLEQMRLVS